MTFPAGIDALLDEYGEQQGWDDRSKLRLLTRFCEDEAIFNVVAFRDFLQREADEENGVEDEPADWALTCNNCGTGHEEVEGETSWVCECCGEANTIKEREANG